MGTPLPRRLKASGLAGHRSRRQNIEHLEARQFLNAAPLGPEPPAAVGAAASRTSEHFDATHFAAFQGPIEYFSPHTVVVEGSFARDPAIADFVAGASHSARVAAFDELAEAEFAEPPALEALFLSAAAFARADNPLVAKPFGEPPDAPSFADAILTPADVFEPSATNPSTGAQATPPSRWTADPHEFDAEFERAVVLLENGWQPGGYGVFSGPDGTLADARPRVAELLRDPPGEVRLAISPVDGIRSSNGALAYFDPAADLERHSIGFAVAFGQSAEGEAAAIGGSAIGGALPTGSWAHTEDAGQIEAAQRAAARHLVGFDQTAHRATVGVSSAAADAAQWGAQQVMSLLVREVLAPHFALDAAALTVAMNELAAQADGLGVRLSEILSPVASGEAALVAGVLGAGLAYRHWRGSRCDRRAEEQDLLSSRFIRGHASIRIGGSS